MSARDREERTHSHTPSAGRKGLLVYWQDHVATYALPERGAITIGRSRECDVFIDHPSVSRKHMTIHVHQGGVSVEDLGSSNGTRLGGRRLAPKKPEPLPAGAILEIGLATV